MGLCDQIHCATNLTYDQGFELEATVAETPKWLKLHNYWIYSSHITGNLSNRCIARYPRTEIDIIKANVVCRMR
jgi:hypothetical protein